MAGAPINKQVDGESEWQFRLVIACEDGRVRVFRVTEDGPCVLQSTSLRQQSKI
jgi:hypothetical protein